MPSCFHMPMPSVWRRGCGGCGSGGCSGCGGCGGNFQSNELRAAGPGSDFRAFATSASWTFRWMIFAQSSVTGSVGQWLTSSWVLTLNSRTLSSLRNSDWLGITWMEGPGELKTLMRSLIRLYQTYPHILPYHPQFFSDSTSVGAAGAFEKLLESSIHFIPPLCSHVTLFTHSTSMTQ